MEENKVALVTGGMGGLGTALCRRLADAGFTVAVTYSPSNAAPEGWLTAQRDDGYRFRAWRLDVTDDRACAAMMAALFAELGCIDVLVNNAGITRDASLRKMTLDDWHQVLRTNLDSVFHMSRHAVGPMTAQRWGRIINISSVNANSGAFGQTNYAAAKAGMHGFTISLARENAGFGITVNTISPGYVATDMVMAVPEEVRAKIIADIPTGRLGKPEEIAYGVSFLVNDEAAWITGSNLDINGGHHMGW